jgi:hypothetical protein
VRFEQILQRVRQVGIVIEEQDAFDIEIGFGLGGSVLLY